MGEERPDTFRPPPGVEEQDGPRQDVLGPRLLCQHRGLNEVMIRKYVRNQKDASRMAQ